MMNTEIMNIDQWKSTKCRKPSKAIGQPHRFMIAVRKKAEVARGRPQSGNQLLKDLRIEWSTITEFSARVIIEKHEQTIHMLGILQIK